MFAARFVRIQYDKGPGSNVALLWGVGHKKARTQITDNIRGIAATKTNRDISEVHCSLWWTVWILQDDTKRDQFYQSVQQSYNITMSKEEIKELNTPDKISEYITYK